MSPVASGHKVPCPTKYVLLAFGDKQIKISGISDPWVGLSRSSNKTLKIKTYRQIRKCGPMIPWAVLGNIRHTLSGPWCVNDYTHLIVPFECPIPGTRISFHPVMWTRTDVFTLFLDAMMEIALL